MIVEKSKNGILVSKFLNKIMTDERLLEEKKIDMLESVAE